MRARGQSPGSGKQSGTPEMSRGGSIGRTGVAVSGEETAKAHARTPSMTTPSVMLLPATIDDAICTTSTPGLGHGAMGSASLHVSPAHHRHSTQGGDVSPSAANLSVVSTGSAVNTSTSNPGLAAASAALALQSAGINAADSMSLGNSIFYDDPDGGSSLKFSERVQHHLEQIHAKMTKTKNKIKVEQANKAKNVNEYLKLCKNASDSQQAARIKAMFEKKNQNSAQTIAQLQKKLEDYEKRKRDLETSPDLFVSHSHKSQAIKNRLKDVGGNISKMGSSVKSKPKEIADLIRRGGKSGGKSGSADNLSSISGSDSNNSRRDTGSHQGSSSLPRDGVGSGGRGSLLSGERNVFDDRKCLSEDGRRHVSTPSESGTSESIPSPSLPATGSSQAQAAAAMDGEVTAIPAREQEGTEWRALMQEINWRKEEVEGLREGMEDLKRQFKHNIETLEYQIREEGERCSRLEEQLNDLIELHQKEIENIKNMVTDHEEITLYQSEERLRDIRESLKMIETKVTNIEVQQAQQQYLHIEGLNSTDARALLMKLLTAAITVAHVVFFIAGLFINFLTPFVRTPARILSTSLVIGVLACYYYQRDYFIAIFHKLKRVNSDKS